MFCRISDAKIFNPLANLCPKQIQETHKHHDAPKKRKYKQEARYYQYRKAFFQLTRLCEYKKSWAVRIENHHKTYGQAQRQNFRAIRRCRRCPRIYQDEG